MQRGTEFHSTTAASERRTSVLAAAKLSGLAIQRNLSPSSRYRISSNATEPPVTPSAGPRSPGACVSPTNVSSLLTLMKKNSTSRLALTASSNSNVAATRGTSKPKFTRYAIAAEATIPMKAPRGSGAGETAGPKLPQKLRQHVSRLRSQFALVSTPSLDNSGARSRSPSMLRGHSPGLRTRAPSVSSTSSRLSIATVALKNQRREVGAEVDTVSTGKSAAPLEGELSPTYKPEEIPTAVVDAGTFRELLKPLQNSLSCASLSSEWSSDEDDAEAEQLFRQSERESSHMLRVCCSLDNLLLSVGDQAQEQKHGEAIARGAARELVKLLQLAVKQVVSVVFGETKDHENNSNRDVGHPVGRLDSKESQYAMEFLLEVMERVGKLDEFVRSALVNEANALRKRVEELESAHEAVKATTDQLQMELRDLRDFHADNNVSTLGSFGNKSSSVTSDANGDPTNSETGFELNNPLRLANEAELDASTAGKNEALEKQCQELLRLLEMAKQEIRLSHHERDAHKARLAEMTTTLFRDEELSLLRNQLQSEKKRVRVLEREILTLRESQQDQTLKLHSLMTNSSGSTLGATAASISSTASTLNPKPTDLSSLSIDALSSSPSALNPPTQVARQELGSSVEPPGGTAALPSHRLAVEVDDGRFNFTSTRQPELGSKDGRMTPTDLRLTTGGLQAIEVSWFTRMIGSSSSQAPGRNVRKLKTSEPKTLDRVAMTTFLADLLMTDRQLMTAQDQTRVRQQGNVPTIAPPVGMSVSKRESRSTEDSTVVKGSSKKRRPQSTAPVSGPDGGASYSEVEEPSKELVASCLQLTWVFYQRFLLAGEARRLINPQDAVANAATGSTASDATAVEPLSLSLVVFQFFLERQAREQDAARELEQFARCIHSARGASFELELFCQFLEGSRSSEELDFLLWVRQAMDDVKLGIPYDASFLDNSNSNVGNSNLLQRQYICHLKATFLARTIFRLLHFKVLCRPASSSGTRRGRSKRRASKRPSSGSAASPTNFSPKRRLKSRLGDELALKLPATTFPGSTRVMDEPLRAVERPVAAHLVAQSALREAIEANHGDPVTLEVFNRLLLQFTVEPSPEELLACTGPFYQPTGDERKLPVDVFLALLMEAYRFQTQWRREQLRALFKHLNQQHEAKEQEAQKLSEAETSADGNKTDKRQDAPNKVKKAKPKKRRKRNSAGDNGAGGPGESKYQRGLTRGVLRDLLLQSGIIHDGSLSQLDLDWLFATLLASTGGSATDIPFDAVYDTLCRMRWLENRELRVDALAVTAGISAVRGRGMDSVSARSRGPAGPLSKAVALALRENWHVQARHSLALCSNDPNVFVRRHSERLLHHVDQQLQQLESPASDGDHSGRLALQGIREFLIFAWRVAAKRTGDQVSSVTSTTCLAELALVNQALRLTGDAFAGYQWQLEASESDLKAADNFTPAECGALRSFYDTSRMHLGHVIDSKHRESSFLSSIKTPTVLQELESILARYAVHLSHLFHRFSEARFNSPARVAFHRWCDMMLELQIVHPRRLPLAKLRVFFLHVASTSSTGVPRDCTTPLSPDIAPLDQDLGVGKTQFTELFVLVALERHRVAATRKLKKVQRLTFGKSREVASEKGASPRIAGVSTLLAHPAQVVAAFCRDVLVPRAFGGDGSGNPLLERNFTAKLGCPLVGRALLEHRAFLRSVFFFYAKQDEDAEDERAALEEKALLQALQENGGDLPIQDEVSQKDLATRDYRHSNFDPDTGLTVLESALDFQLEKTKRNSMSFGEFQTFLRQFGLLKGSEGETRRISSENTVVSLAVAQRVFRSVMALDNDDISQLEFDEFAAAVVALAVHLDPSPFTLWHKKIDTFVCSLRAIHQSRDEHPALG